MSDAEFDLAWLDLRRAADARGRNRALEARLAAALDGRDAVTVVEIGAGAGAGMAALAPLIPARQHWHLVDRDARLLAVARERAASLRDAGGRPIEVSTRVSDLGAPSLRDAGLAEIVDGADLITTAAFLDLASRIFVERLAAAAATAGAVVHAALSVDGRIAIEPTDPGDTAILDAFNRHMLRDKGLGPALGPRAADVAAHALRAHGYHVELGRSDWVLDADDAGLATTLVDGWATAAAEILTEQGTSVADLGRWQRRRGAEAARGALRIIVGHLDLVAIPPAAPSRPDASARPDAPSRPDAAVRG